MTENDPVAEDTAELIFDTLRHLTWMLRAAIVLEIPINQVRVLGRLGGGPATMAEIAEVLQLSKSSATLVINEMEANGLVERTRGTNDKRLVFVCLTSLGDWLRGRRRADILARLGQILSLMTPEERRAIKSGFSLMYEAVINGDGSAPANSAAAGSLQQAEEGN